MSVHARRIVLWAVLAALLAAGLGYAFWPRPVPVDLATVQRGKMIVTVDEEGFTRVREVFVLSSPIAGRMRRIERHVGEEVIADRTIIANIEPSDPSFLDVRSEAEAQAAVQSAEAARSLAEAKVAEARAELEFARTELERARRLVVGQTITKRAVDEAQRAYKTRSAAVQTAQAELRVRISEVTRARARLVSPVETQTLHGVCECIPLFAPVSGRILRLVRESEGVVQAGDALVEIGDPRDLEIAVEYLSTDAVRIEPGQRVIIDEWGGGSTLAGRVRRVEPYGFTKVSALGIEEQRVKVIIDLTDPPERWARLGHGFRVETRVVLWEAENVLKVPLTALFRNGGDWTVFVAADGKAARRKVQVGHRTGLEAEIVGGLKEGERIVLHPSDRIDDGVRVSARES